MSREFVFELTYRDGNIATVRILESDLFSIAQNTYTLKFYAFKLNQHRHFEHTLTPYGLSSTTPITIDFVQMALEHAETLINRPRYMPPHYDRSKWITACTDAANDSKFPFKEIEDRLTDLPVRVVVCAANRIVDGKPHAGLIIPANRHHSPTMNALYTALGIKGGFDDQGFIDQWGQFMDRKEALKVAMSSGQPFNVERNGCGNPPDELYSEGIC